ncbi:MAG: DUF58 domain-containing protein [Clostridiales bacterium]|nr:DUF58 domain-containing protein [Clostridiales bacterium]
MRLNYISQIKSNLKKSATISTKRPTSNILDGSYISVYKGRSLNFDDLREYVPGDDVKDIDWKATARSQTPLVREYIAEKKHNIMFVLDTNKRMLAHTSKMSEKKDVALYTAGTLAYLVSRNGDYISSVFSTERSMQYFPFKTGLMNIENILQAYDKALTPRNESGIVRALDYIMRNIRRRMIVIIVTDMEGKRSISDTLFKRLATMHDVLLIDISDTDASGSIVYDVETFDFLPDYFTKDKKLLKREAKRKEQIEKESSDKLKKNGIVWSKFDNTDDIAVKITELLARHKLEKR